MPAATCLSPFSRFFNLGTRAIFIQFVLYNTNSRQLSNVRLLMEVFPSSAFITTAQIDSTKIVVYESKTDQVLTTASTPI